MSDKQRDPRSDANAIPDRPGEGGGVATGLQPGGTIPGGGPGTNVGSIGTGGGQTGDSPNGNAKRPAPDGAA